MRLNEYALTEEIEKFVNYVDGEGESVRPPMAFVKAYTTRDDRVLATLAAIATEPIVLADGEILGRENGFDRARGIQFIIPDEVLAALPRREDLSDAAVATAMKFLIDDWLIDVEADFEAKCSIVAAALTMIERSVLSMRPVFFVTAGRAGGGKTTTIYMIISAVTGNVPAAQAWTGDENERRKALHSHLMAGAAYVVWDNIPRGERITCPHIERSCTTAYYVDRKLGVSETVMASAATIHFFTGNNIEARGDLSSRAINIRVKTERADPEDRPYKHSDPLAWTAANRAAILRALYTVLLGNPKLRETRDAAMKTRFKTWYRIIGSAVEHAAELAEARTRRGAHRDRARRQPRARGRLSEAPPEEQGRRRRRRRLARRGPRPPRRLVDGVGGRDGGGGEGGSGGEGKRPAAAAEAEGAVQVQGGRPPRTPQQAAGARQRRAPPRGVSRVPLSGGAAHRSGQREVSRPPAQAPRRRTGPVRRRTLILRTGPDPKAGTSHPVAVFWVETREDERAGRETEDK